MASTFFKTRQAAAVLKHELLVRYLRVFVQKTGSTAPGHQVAFLDGYAGPGAYEDGNRGSPAIAIDVARIVAANDNLRGFLVEDDPDTFSALQQFVAQERPDWSVYKGDIETHLPDILSKALGLPMFAFLDPFGPGIPFTALTGTLLGRSPGVATRRQRQATEVLLNFSLSGLRRFAGHLGSAKTYKAKDAFIDRLDSVLDGPWWRSIWETEPASTRETIILDEYMTRLSMAHGRWTVTPVPVADRWEGPPIYYLIHLTQHRDGEWEFNQALSMATEVYRQYCHETVGKFDLYPLDDRASDWVNAIEHNLEELLAAEGAFVIGDRVPEVYGSTLGVAREMHVRAAIDTLHTRGTISTSSKGNIRNKRLEPTGGGQTKLI